MVAVQPVALPFTFKSGWKHQARLYEYTRLTHDPPEIRLLSILPRCAGEILSIEIEHVRFDPLLMRRDDEDEEPLPSWSRFPKLFRNYIPEKWSAEQIPDGRFLYRKIEFLGDEVKCETSWDFPVHDLAEQVEQATAPVPPRGPLFEALSYSWGKPGDRLIPIRVISRLWPTGASDSILNIQPSLFQALYHLRLETTRRRLWVDAICINQFNEAEKSIHIPYMWAIYKHAWRTIVWLGPQRDESQVAMQKLAYIAAQSVMLRDGQMLPSPECSDLDTFRDAYSALECSDIQAITHLLERQYFRRLWIVSELAMADTRAYIYCGNLAMSLIDFRTAVHCLLSSKTRPPQDLLQLLQGGRALLLPNASTAFSTLLESYRHHGCSMAHDKVYGLISMASIAFMDCIDLDYSISAGTLYKEVFLAIVKFFERLDILQACRLDISLLDLPSWVPNFAQPYSYRNPLELCSGISEPMMLGISDERIRVSGIRCCKVEKTCSGLISFADSMKTITAWFDAVQSPQSKYPTSESIQDVFYRTICLDRTTNRYPGSANLEAKFDLKELVALLDDATARSGSSMQRTELIAQLGSLLEGRDFFQAEGGYFGLGPGISRPGDVVCALLGSTNLTLLRPQNDGTYVVVGHCFVHGFHDNTAFAGPLPAGWRVVIIDDEYGGHKIRYRNFAKAGRDVNLEICDADTVHDPRLGDLPIEWEWSECERTKNDPDLFEEYYHEADDRYIHSDPRMSVEALERRGIHLETFDLV